MSSRICFCGVRRSRAGSCYQVHFAQSINKHTPPFLPLSLDSLAVLVEVIPVGSLCFGLSLVLSLLESDENKTNDGDQSSDDDAGNGSGVHSDVLHRSVGGRGGRVLAGGNVALGSGLFLAELVFHGGLAAQLLDVHLRVVDGGLSGGVEVFEVDVLNAEILEVTLQDLVDVVDLLSVGGVVHEVVVKITGRDGQLELDGRGILVLDLVLVNAEKFEEIGVALLVVATLNDKIAAGNGGLHKLELDVRGILVLNLVLVNAERFEEIDVALLVVAILNDKIASGNGLLQANVDGKVLNGVVCGTVVWSKS